jgi:peptide/nickel transport system permease protein
MRSTIERTAALDPPQAPVAAERRPSLFGKVGRALAKDVLAILSIVVLAAVLLAALAPGLLLTHDPIALSMDRLEPSSTAHFFGTDQFGRDIFSRCIAAAQISLLVGFVTVLLALAIGIPLGAIAGYVSPGWLDNAIMRLMDVLLAFPSIILAITVIAALGTEPLQIGPVTLPHIAKLMFVIGVLYAPEIARIVRSAVLVEREEQYVAAERALGTATSRILFLDILRNCLSPVMVHATLLVANAIIAEAALSFLGLGIQPPDPSWGGMLADARTYVASGEWWMTIFPGLLIFFTVCALNVLGDFLRDLLDPRDVGSGPRG